MAQSWLSGSGARHTRFASTRQQRRRSIVPQIQVLEDRLAPAGTWTNLAPTNPGLFGPGGGQAMMLLSDGTVAVQKGSDAATTTWFRLTPNASGSYVNGTWSTLASMNNPRLFFTTVLLKDGRIMAVGGEYPNFQNTVEIFNPLTNTWTNAASVPTPDGSFGDDPITVLPDGRVLAGYYADGHTFIYNPTTNTWVAGPNKVRDDASDEESWVKLSDGSILSYDVFSSIDTGVFHAQRYIPSTNTWVDASAVNAANPPSILSRDSEGFELGPALRLPDGRVIFFGTEGHTAYYNEATNQWSAGPNEPTVGGRQYVATDDPGAILPNGKILVALSPDWSNGSFPAPTHVFELDPATGVYTDVTPAGMNFNSFFNNMLMLPTGQVLMASAAGNTAFRVYTPDLGPQDAWRPTFTSLINNGNGTFTLNGTQLNGLSEGATYGDDWESASNYPIARFTNSAGTVFYGRTFSWSSTGVATGATPQSTLLVLPAGHTLADFDTITIIANGIPSLPHHFVHAGPESYTTAEDTPLTINAPGLLNNDSTENGAPTLSASLVTNATNGNVVVNADGSFTYTPNLNFNGADSFVYRVTAGGGSDVSTVNITVTPVNDPPIALDDPNYVVEVGTLLTVNGLGVLANDTDVENDPLTAIQQTATAHGTLFLQLSGSFTYMPNAGYSGLDSFTYKAFDGKDLSNLATVTIRVNHRPVALGDNFGTIWNQLLVIGAPGVLANDSDADNDPMSAELVSTTTHGALNFLTNGGFTYTPNANFFGADSFTYRVRDAYFVGNTVTVNIAVDRPPLAGDDSYSAVSGQFLNVGVPGVLWNDFNFSGGPLSAQLVQGPSYGSLTFNSDGSFQYLAVNNFTGTDTFQYRAFTAGGIGSNLATVRLAVTAPPNQPPLAVDDFYSANQGFPLTIGPAGVLGNDSDPDGDALTAAQVSSTAHGLLGFQTNGSFTYTPNAGFVGQDSFTYQAFDGQNFSNVATVTIQVNAGSPPPSATDDGYSTVKNQQLVINAPGVLANDTDPQHLSLTALLASTTTHGTLNLQTNGSFTYTPNANFTGSDTFTYRASNGSQQSNLATVTLTVTNLLLPPNATNDSYTTQLNQGLIVSAPGVLNNDNDPQGLGLSALLVSGPTNGSLQLNGDGSFSFLPSVGFVGQASFTYRAVNSAGLQSNVATVGITVIPGSGGPGQTLVVAPDVGLEPRVRVYDGSTRTEKTNFLAFEGTFTGGVRVATGDLTGDGIPDIVVASGPGRTATVKVYDGVTYQPLTDARGNLTPFGSTTVGVYVALGDVNGDGVQDIITSLDAGSTPTVHVYNGRNGRIFTGTMGNFQAYPSAFHGGVRVAAGDVNGDGKAEVVTAPGAGTISGGLTGMVRTFDLTRSKNGAPFIIQQFVPYETSFAGGVFVGTGNLDGDGRMEIVTTPGAGRVGEVRVFEPNHTTSSRSFTPLGSYTGGLHVGVGDVDGDGRQDLIIGTGGGTTGKARFYDAITLQEMFAADNGLVPFSGFTGGLWVAGVRTGP